MDYQFNAAELEQQIDELEKAFRQLDDSLARHIQGRGLQEMAKVVARKAKALVPVKTGALQNSIRVRRTGERFRGRKIPGGSAAVFAGGTGARHANLIELGTVRAPAYPFLAPALLSDRGAQRAALVRGTARELDKQVRRIATGTQTRGVTRIIQGG